MSACGMSLSSIGLPVNVISVRGLAPSEMRGFGRPARISASTASAPKSFSSVLTNLGSDRRVSARLGMDPAAASGLENIWDTDARHRTVAASAASSTSQETEVFHARGWSEVAWDEGALLEDQGLADLRARESFISGGDISEENMERLVAALVSENGQSAEDYQIRAVLSAKIAEFYSTKKSYSLECTRAAKSAKVIQLLVDKILADDGRSAMDYNLRAQFFAKSAATFPFNSVN